MTLRSMTVVWLAAASILPAQMLAQLTPVSPMTMTRGKMWIKANPNGSLERESNLGLSGHDWEVAYPGYYDNRNEAVGGWDANAIYNGAQVAGQDVAWMYRNNFNAQNIFAITQTSLNSGNYNLLTTANAPEEMLNGSIGSDTLDANGRRHMAYKLDGQVMAWSVPGYSDFIIIRCTLTSRDPDTLKNFYYARYVTPDGPYRPSSVSSGWDKEYIWDSGVSDTLGFLFYDDTSLPPTGPAPAYSIFPGNITGNAGDPGNIGTQGSRNFKLYSPSVYAFSFLPMASTMTANKYGERKVWRRIVSSASTAPAQERMPGSWNGELATNYSTLVSFLTDSTLYPQPKISWRRAYDSIQAGNTVPGAGSLWERNPRYVYAIGPYDIAPGRSITWTELLVCGMMDRNVTMKGDTLSTKHFVQEGIANLKKNWAAARSLIAGNFRFPTGKVPPPTPANAPKTGTANGLGAANPELLVTPGESQRDGRRVPGVNITWNPVHLKSNFTPYTDPQNGRRDFAAYKVYRSDNAIEGPWVLMDSLWTAKAESLRHAGPDTTKVTYFIESPAGVPYRYCVTSIDTSRNESAMSGYSYYPVSSEPNPSNAQRDIVVVPNPFRQVSGYSDQTENKRLSFVNIPSRCTIRIYTVALDLVKTLEHDGAGLQAWGSQANQDYMQTDFGQNVMPGIYIYHVESHVSGHEGETSVGKFAVIR
jgi:hypothetical protein